ncbi:MAG: septum formation protein Maf, partial [Chloroflexi bacterium]|nr:septum formation protein Maf [Chloroflexota bacterium]
MRRVFILASTSPRRRELIQLFGLPFHFVSADVDETPRDGESPEILVRRLSRAKAERAVSVIASGVCEAIPNLARGDCFVAKTAPRNDIIIAADTLGVLDDEILGKPRDAEDATRMLKALRARPHIVYSGITVTQGEESMTRVATTTVRMREYSDAEIAAYVATGDPFDKAAAYAIQHNGFRPVARIDGCQANVMGLPLCDLYVVLREFGIALAEPDRACQHYLDIVCPVAREILSANYA